MNGCMIVVFHSLFGYRSFVLAGRVIEMWSLAGAVPNCAT